MEVQFREMSEKEFKIFFENSINDYATDLIKSTVATTEEAFAEAKREFAEMLPNGLGTKDNALRIIVDAAIRICNFNRNGTGCPEKWLCRKAL